MKRVLHEKEVRIRDLKGGHSRRLRPRTRKRNRASAVSTVFFPSDKGGGNGDWGGKGLVWSSHSLRIGGATDVMLRGDTALAVQQLGRWHSLSFLTFIRPYLLPGTVPWKGTGTCSFYLNHLNLLSSSHAPSRNTICSALSVQ
jgi:hypothetical protein